MTARPEGRPAAGGLQARAVRSLPGLVGRLLGAWMPQLAALAAAAGAVAATIAGALGVGDALARGLRQVALERLGRIDAAVVGEDFFTARLAADLGALAAAGADAPTAIVPALVLDVTVESAGGPAVPATLLACDDPAALGFAPPPPPLRPGVVLLNEPLARAVAAAVDTAVVLRLPRRSGVPADSPLGRRTGESAARRLSVGAVLPAVGIGQFALRPTQVTAPLVVAPLETARAILGADDAVNAVFATAARGGDAAAWLRAAVRPRLADVGLSLAATDGVPRLTSRRLILPDAVDRAAAAVLAPAGGRPSLAFLANDMRPLDAAGLPAAAGIPYSTVLGIDATDHPAGPLVDDAGRPLPLPAADEIVIDRWMADDLAAQGRAVAVGDRLELRFFAPETLHGRVVENAATFRIAGIAAMRGAAVARELVPEVEGVSDEASIADWDPPFPFDAARVRTTPPRDEDDRYWKAHGTTPKAFVALEAARRVAAGRFGATTAWHLPAAAAGDLEPLRERLAAVLPAEAVGLRVLPLRAEAVAAARGSTPFGGLFLALSSFVVAAGLLLEWLLFRLLVASRARSLGILAAGGWPPRRLATLLVGIGGAAAAAGVVVGTALGPAWARGLLAVLARAWDADVAAGSARVFQATPPSWTAALPGGLAAWAVSLVALAWAARQAGRQPPWRLLRGAAEPPTRGGTRSRGRGIVAGLALVAAVAVASAGGRAEPTTAVAAFFAAGCLALGGLLGLLRLGLRRPPARPLATLGHLAARGVARATGRAFAVAAIVAIAEFLVVAVSAFAVRPPADPGDRRGPTGGWSSLATLNSPTAVDPLAADAAATFGLTDDERRALAGCTIARLRSNRGDDASCTNLYAAGRPTVLGAGPAFVARGGFSFVAHAALPPGETNPWTLLDRAAGPVPAILDQATAQWALKVGGVGARFTVPDDAGRPVECEIVGLLAPGILQGAVLVAERRFEGMFPERSGYGMALVDEADVPPGLRAAARAGLGRAWADAGPSLTTTLDRLRGLMAVQNTFLAGFQALGALGLLLGTAGVAAVQVQGVLDRIGPLSLLRAIGFAPGRIRLLLVLETLATVGLGLAVGGLAGCLAVAPALARDAARLPLGWIAVTCGLTLVSALVASLVAASRATIPERPPAAGG